MGIINSVFYSKISDIWIMKLWDKGQNTNQWIEQFTIGQDQILDLRLAPHDVLGSLAHIRMLAHIALITEEELQILSQSLVQIYHKIQAENFEIEAGIEDVHSQVELLLTRELGEVGKKIHAGRSRNDQVLLDLKLLIRKEIQDITSLVSHLFDTLLQLSEQYKNILMPGYTHLQVAMPSSFGLWFGAYAESLSDDILLWQSVYRITNQNPLGSAAGYGSSFPLNRQMTTDLLGFERLNYNVVYAQMGRGKVERIVSFALANFAATLGKMAMDITLYMNQNFGFISFPDEFTTGSSIMPHKKNPDVFELIRAKCNRLQALPNEITLISNNLPSGYHRDLQLVKESFLPAFDTLKDCVTMMQMTLEKIIVKDQILEDEKYRYLFSVEEVNQLVLQGLPFRDAYKAVGKMIEEGTYKAAKQVNHSHEGSIGQLCQEQIREKMQEIIQSFHFDKVNQAEKALLKL